MVAAARRGAARRARASGASRSCSSSRTSTFALAVADRYAVLKLGEIVDRGAVERCRRATQRIADRLSVIRGHAQLTPSPSSPAVRAPASSASPSAPRCRRSAPSAPTLRPASARSRRSPGSIPISPSRRSTRMAAGARPRPEALDAALAGRRGAPTCGRSAWSTPRGRSAAWTGERLHALVRADRRGRTSPSRATCWSAGDQSTPWPPPSRAAAALDLDERLCARSRRAQAAGGDKRGRQSAALLVHGEEDYPCSTSGSTSIPIRWRSCGGSTASPGAAAPFVDGHAAQGAAAAAGPPGPR